MSIASTLEHVLNFIKGIHIPGVSIDTTKLLASVEQSLADRYGAAGMRLATELASKVGLSGPDKLFAVVKAMFDDAMANGFKGDGDLLKAELVKIAQAAFVGQVDNVAAKAEALAISLTKNPLVGTVTSLVVQELGADLSGMVGSQVAAQPLAA